MPPYRTLGFNPQVVVDDALLLSEYMNNEKMSHKEATAALSKDIETLRSNLCNTGVVCFGDLGTFTMDIEGKIFFAPNENGIDAPENYGFEPLAIAPLSELKKKDIVIKRSNVAKYVSAVAAVIVLAFVLVPFGKKMYNDDTQLSVAGFTTTEEVSRPVVKTTQVVSVVAEREHETSPVIETEVVTSPVKTLKATLPVKAIEIIEIDEEIEEPEILEEIEDAETIEIVDIFDFIDAIDVPEVIESAITEENAETFETLECVEVIESETTVESIEAIEPVVPTESAICVEEVINPIISEPAVEGILDTDVAVELTENVIETESVIEKTEKHSIIVASTPNAQNAQLAITELSRKMKADYEVVEGDRRFRIAIETYDNADDANLALERIQQTFSDAWIYVH